VALVPARPSGERQGDALRFDLHLHSHVSDGRVSPVELVRGALDGGLDVIALTDHDTAAGVPEAVAAAEGTRLFVVPGIEVSTRHGVNDLHILGYWVDPDHPAILAHQAVAASRREVRMHGMIDRLRALGITVRFEEVLEAAGPGTRVLGRPHLARAMVAAGHVRYFGEAFDRYLHDGGPAFVLEAFPSVVEAIDMIHRAGGLAVWAHPPRDVFEVEIRAFADAGLDGVECLRPGSLPSDAQYLEGVAESLGLLVTGGSDWHGPHHNPLGEFSLRPHEIRAFLDAPQSSPLRALRAR
jgi:3',5'-nucleoside bisphosphate phosphatase